MMKFVPHGIFLFLAASNSAWALGELRDLYFGARSKAMGGAYAGLADDEQAIFLNPAGLAGLTNRSIHYLPLDIDLSKDIYTSYSDSSEAFKHLDADSVNALMGKNIYARAQLAPSLVLPNFGIAFLSDYQAALYTKNQALPNITFGWENTNGVQVAAGFSLTGPKRRRKKNYPDLSVGLGVKMMWRRGGYRKVPLVTLFNVNQGSSLISGLAGEYGLGIGADLGLHYVHPLNKQTQLGLGLVYTDIGDTSFNSQADPQRGNFKIGTSVTYTAAKNLKVNFAYDYSHILEDTDWRQRNHLGLEVAFPVVSLYAGLNQVYWTGGFAVDVWVVRLTALTYEQELGTFVHQDGNRRYSLKFDFKFNI